MTFCEAQTELADYAPADKLPSRINQACERLINSGRWKGTICRVGLVVPAGGILALPRNFDSIHSAKVDGTTRQIYNGWFEFLPNTSDSDRGAYATIEDLGHFATQRAIPDASYVYAVSTGSGSVILQGRDQNGEDVLTLGEPGKTLAFNASIDTTQEWSEISSVVFPPAERTATVSLYAKSVATEEITLLGVYHAADRTPTFHRYFVRELSDAEEATTIVARVKRRYVKAVSDYDIIQPDNIGALANAMQSLHFESVGDLQRAMTHMQLAIKLLNDELKSTRTPGSFPGIRVHVVGQTLSSFPSFR